MDREVFTWIPDDEATLEGEFKLRTAQFGDGYEQVSGDGLNSDRQTWTLTFGGSADEIEPILAFIRRHGGAKAFLWTDPNGAAGLYRCATYRNPTRPAGISILSLTFTQSFQP